MTISDRIEQTHNRVTLLVFLLLFQSRIIKWQISGNLVEIIKSVANIILYMCNYSTTGFSMSFVYSKLRSEVIVCFVDINETINHHCLNFLYIITN
jgi:hypothetical protein